MADLKTDYKDDVLDTEVNELRKYQMIQNEDGTVSFVDVTEYLQVGDSFGSADINETNAEIEEIKDNQEVKYQELENAIDTKVTNNFTANRAVYADANGELVASGAITDTELGYLDGVTSNIQTQLDNKLSTSGGTLYGFINGTAQNAQFSPDGNVYSDLWGGWLSNALASKFPKSGGVLDGNILTHSILPGTANTFNVGGIGQPYLGTYVRNHYMINASSEDCGKLTVQQDGTTSTEGVSSLFLGNSIPAGTDANARGQIVLYNNKSNYAYLYASPNMEADVGLMLPNKSGIVPVVSVSGTTLTLEF